MLKKALLASCTVSIFFINPVYGCNNNLSDQNILNMIINGNYDKKSKSMSHELPKEIVKTYNLENVHEFKTNIIFNRNFKQDNKIRQIVVTQTRNETSDCHACAPIIGISVLEKSNNTWKIKVPFNYVDRIGTWGQAPKPQFKEIGKNNYGLVFDSGYSNMGMTTNTTIIVGQVDNKYKVLHNEPDTYEDNAGVCGDELKRDCYKYDSKLTFIKSNNKYYPIVFSYSGTKPDKNDKAVKYKEVKKYIFSKNKYLRSN